MTNKIRNILTVALIAIFILIVCGYVGAKHLQKTSPICNFIFSPSDLYTPLVCTEFNLSENNNYELEFKNKYPGNHKLEVLVEKPTDISEAYKTKFKLRVDIISEGHSLLNAIKTEENIWPFWGIKKESGFAILTYKVPYDLPQEKALTALIHIEESDEAFFSRYGKQRLCLSKYSDE